MNEELKEHVTNTGVWMRLLFMALFGIIYTVSRVVLLIVVVAQFLWLLITGSTNPRLLSFGGQLATFVYQILRYLTFNSETRPFPFADWPNDSELTVNHSDNATAVMMSDTLTARNEEESMPDSGSETGIEISEPVQADSTPAGEDHRIPADNDIGETGSETGIESTDHSRAGKS